MKLDRHYRAQLSAWKKTDANRRTRNKHLASCGYRPFVTAEELDAQRALLSDRYNDTPSFWTRYGNWWAVGCFVCFVLCIVAIWVLAT